MACKYKAWDDGIKRTILNDVGEQSIEEDYRATKPKLRDIEFDTVNNKIVAVGEQNKDSTNTSKRGIVLTFPTNLVDTKFRNLHTSASSSLNVSLYKCSLDNTLNPNNRLWVSGEGLSSTQTSLGRVGGIISSVPINNADTTNNTSTIEDWSYEVHGSVTVDIVSPLTQHDTGMTIDDSTATASGLVNGTTSTSVSGFVEYKMVLDTSIQQEQESQDPTYALSSTATSVNEGQSFQITLTTTNVADGTNVPFTITGVSSADIDGRSLTGVFTVFSNTASVTINVTADNITD